MASTSVLWPFCAHHRHASHHNIVLPQFQFRAQRRVLDDRRQGDGRINRRDMAGVHAALDQTVAHIVADGGDAVGNHRVRQQRPRPVCQVAGPDDERRARQAPGAPRDQRIAAAVSIEHIEAPRAQDLAQRPHPFEKIGRPVHEQGMHDETLIAQAICQQRVGLARRLEIMAAFAHGQHFFEYAVFLAPKAGRGLGMQDTQRGHE